MLNNKQNVSIVSSSGYSFSIESLGEVTLEIDKENELTTLEGDFNFTYNGKHLENWNVVKVNFLEKKILYSRCFNPKYGKFEVHDSLFNPKVKNIIYYYSKRKSENFDAEIEFKEKTFIGTRVNTSHSEIYLEKGIYTLSGGSNIFDNNYSYTISYEGKVEKRRSNRY